uniref:Uncharacterized protein n=1 Tax=Chaetoceros debilis TaxID=122233 RepID=A0A7S3PWM5_9STRA
MNQQSKVAAASSTPAGCTMSVTVSTSNSIMNSNATPKPNLKSATMASTAYKSSHGVSSGTGMAKSNSNLIASTATPINHRAANNSKPTGGLGLARFQATPIQNQQQKTAPRQFISNASATTNPYLSNQHHRQQLQQQQQQQQQHRSNPISSNSSISSAPPPPFANRTRPNNASNKSNALANISTNLSRATPLSNDNKNPNGKRPYQATNPYMNSNKK